MDLVNEIQQLIFKGEELRPKGGHIGLGYNGELQAEYLSWRLQAITIVSKLGEMAAPLILELDKDSEGRLFFESSAANVLGVLKAAFKIAEEQEFNNLSNTSTKSKPAGYFEILQICLNGHIVNFCAKKDKQFNKEYCIKCGTKTITSCLKCKTLIQGVYFNETGIPTSSPSTIAPQFCHQCGKPYKWTEIKIQAAKDLFDEIGNLKPKEREKLKKSIDDLVIETPKTSLAITIIKKFASKIGEEGKKIVVDIASEAVKKMLTDSFK